MINLEPFKSLQFQFPFRRYQKLILNQMESADDDRYHIVAPPGSGKTIVGIELIRRLGQPAVVFAPTTTIQLQWKEKFSMFLPPHSKVKINDIVSTDPKEIRLINIYTYQLISTAGSNLDFAEETARGEWINALITHTIAQDETDAIERITTLKTNNPAAYRKDLAKYYKAVKSQLLKDPEFDRIQFLHENARELIQRLVDSGVKTIVMDEVHHLLDYWAVVITELINRIEDPKIIGLTATPPLSVSEREINNYLSIVGAIDFEIPTPAVVKEGNLAPYQDLVYFCEPTSREKQYFKRLQKDFEVLVSEYGQSEVFYTWIQERVIQRKNQKGEKESWSDFFNKDPMLGIAGVKYLQQIRREDMPKDIIEIEEMAKPIELDDWVELLTDYALRYLKLSSDPALHEEYDNIRKILKTFGFVLTESGLRRHRSPSDLILALSEAKHKAVLTILETEMDSIGTDLRAVVITDFEVESATAKRQLEGVLDSNSGSAARVFREIAENKRTTLLEPILVTGKTVLIDIDNLEEITAAMKTWKQNSGLTFECSTEPTEYERIVKLVGSGKDWRSNTYVRMVTELFEQGIIKCIVGTRGLLGEGWDSISLNTLIDLTAATTSMTVNQVRGRSIRLDPHNPTKVANNWDVVCVETSFAKGKQDFERFLNKHQKFYGLGSKGKIVKGVLHVDEKLVMQLSNTGFNSIAFNLINSQMLEKGRKRKEAYEAWRIGEEYQNFEYSATKLDPEDIKFKTVYTLRDSLKHIFNNIMASIVTACVAYFMLFGDFIEIAFINSVTGFIAVVLFTLFVFAFSVRNIKKYIQRAFIELPIDSYILDIAKALLSSLRESSLIDPSQSVDNIRVVEDGQGYYDIYLDYAKPEDTRTFSKALRELLAPVSNQRYVVSRSEDTIPIGFYQPLWWIFRKLFRVAKQQKTAYHPVPDVLAINKKRAANFGKNWKKYVGGGDLVYTRSEKGSQILLKLREYNHHRIKRLGYEIWK